jgi:phosphonatase-like hydrolase
MSLAVFDVAGTTVDDEDHAVARCVCAALAKSGVDSELADVNPVMGMYKPLAIRLLMERAMGRRVDEAEVQSVYRDFERRMIEHYANSPSVRALPGAEEAFTGLRERGMKVALDTGFDRSVLDAILERLGWRDKIDASVTSDEVANGRPAPDMIHSLMSRLAIDVPASVLKVGDSVSDIEEGLNARCGLVVAILCERTRDAIPRFPGVLGVASVAEVVPIVDAFHAGRNARMERVV